MRALAVLKMILKVAIQAVMIVCVCAGVSERQLEAVVAGGATTLKEVGRRCGAGTGCGACRSLVRDVLRRAHADAATAPMRTASAPAAAPAVAAVSA
jgi:bacterioferritin-associated ferredoxin